MSEYLKSVWKEIKSTDKSTVILMCVNNEYEYE